MNDVGQVLIVDDDPSICSLIEAAGRDAGLESHSFPSAEAFLAYPSPNRPTVVLLDLELPGTSGLDLLERHFRDGSACPVIVITGKGSVQSAVKSMKLGAVDFLEKPFDRPVLLKLVQASLETDRLRREENLAVEDVRRRLASLSPRERELLIAIIEGKSTKMIADQFEISARTIDHHRANLMDKMKAANVADLVRMAVRANFTGAKTPV